MTRKKWFILFVVALVSGLMVAALILGFILGFFAGRKAATDGGLGLPLYTTEQSASTHPGYRHTTMTCGDEVYVNDYEEACLQLAYADPQTFIGHIGSIGNAKVGI